jgi:hypothetical protein
LMGGENYALEFENLSLFLNRPLYVHKRLSQITGRLKAYQGSCESLKLNDRPPS